MTTKKRVLTSVAVLALGAAVAVTSAGCSALGLAAYAASGPQKVPPRYVLPKVPTIVIVESSRNPGYASLDAQQIATQATSLMRKHGLTFVLDAGLAVDQTARHTGRERMRPAELARACGAQQLIYVDLTSYGTTSALAGEAADGQAAAAVWVVDANTTNVLWPPEANQGFPIAAKVPFSPTANGQSEQGIRSQINEKLGTSVGQLFYEWTESE